MDTSRTENQKLEKPNYHSRIKLIREARNYTQEYMAEALHLSQRAYSSIENGQTQLTVERLYEIAEALQVSIGEIINTDNQSIYYNNFNNHAPNNKGNLVFHQDAFDEQRSLYERLLKTKEEEINYLKELLKNK